MVILKFFKSNPEKADHEGVTYEILESHLSIDSDRYRVRIKKKGREFYVEDLFQSAKKPKDLTFSRFFLLNEKPPKPHFAPSQKEAVDWFRGRNLPKDGYEHIFWGEQTTYECSICRTRLGLPLRITQVERLSVATDIPRHREIVGWRVVEVESELTGRGIPTRRLEENKLKPTILWYQVTNRYLCRSCARKLADVDRAPDATDYIVFEPE